MHVVIVIASAYAFGLANLDLSCLCRPVVILNQTRYAFKCILGLVWWQYGAPHGMLDPSLDKPLRKPKHVSQLQY